MLICPKLSFAGELTAREASLVKVATYSVWFILIGLGYLFYQYQTCHDKKAYLRSGPIRSTLLALIITIVAVSSVNFLAPPAAPAAAHDKQHEEKTEALTDWKSDSILFAAAEANLLSHEAHLKYIRNHFSLPLKNAEGHDRDDLSIENFYFFLSQSESMEYAEVGKYFFGLCRYYRNSAEEAVSYLHKVKHTSIPSYHYYLGEIYHKLGQDSVSVQHLWTETEKENGWVDESFHAMVPIVVENNMEEELIRIFHHNKGIQHIPYPLQTKLFFKEGSYLEYYKLVLTPRFSNISLKGFMFAAAILLIWIYYLYFLDIYQREKFVSVLAVILAGMGFSLLSFWISDFNSYILGFRYGGGALHDLLFCIVGIGAVEELVKILPLLVLLAATDILDEPFDYILYAAASALGFAFIENLFYFQKDSDTIIHSRALFSVVGHMFDTSLIAYGIILVKFRSLKLPGFVIVGAFFCLACIAHGVYDFLLFYDFYLLFIFLFLVSIMIWVIMINNAINNSAHFNYQVKLNYDRLQVFLTVSLSLVLYAEYILVGFTKGASVANTVLIGAVFNGGGLIVFYANRLSRFDLVNEHWFGLSWKLKFKKGKTNSLGVFFMLAGRVFLANAIIPKNFVGRKIILYSAPKNQTLREILGGGVAGEIVRRGRGIVTRKGKTHTDPDFFLVKLEREINWGQDQRHDHCIIQFGGSPSFLMDKYIEVKVFYSPVQLMPEQNDWIVSELVAMEKGRVNPYEAIHNESQKFESLS